MDKNTSLSLLGVTVILFAYTSYYAATRPPVVVVATSTPEVIGQVLPDKDLLTAQDGRTVLVKETNPSGESLSTITLTPGGFDNNTPIILEKNKLTRFFLADLNGDNHDELVLVTTAQGSGSYGDITLFTTASGSKLLPLPVPELTEDMTKSGKLFEGYMGHDVFKFENGLLVREFPLFTATDTNTLPTGGSRKIVYSILPDASGTLMVTMDAYKPLPVSTSTPSTTLTQPSSSSTPKTASTTP